MRPVVRKTCEGYNGNLFAYGNSGCGKSFTLLGTRDSPGFLLLSVGDIFHCISQQAHRQFLLRFSCAAISEGRLVDLLGSMADLNDAVALDKLREPFVRSANEFVALLLNATSRERQLSVLTQQKSHIMFRIFIESCLVTGQLTLPSRD